MILALCLLIAAVAAWGGAVATRTLSHYEQARRALPYRTLATVLLAVGLTELAVPQALDDRHALILTLWSVVFALITVVDYETHYIPNVLIFPAILASLALSFVHPLFPWISAAVGAALGGALMGILYLAGRRLYQKGLGYGDVWLAILIGAVVGLQAVLYSLMAGVLLGGVIIALLLATRRITLRTYVPYGPFLCLGGYLGMLPVVQRFWGLM